MRVDNSLKFREEVKDTGAQGLEKVFFCFVYCFFFNTYFYFWLSQVLVAAYGNPFPDHRSDLDPLHRKCRVLVWTTREVLRKFSENNMIWQTGGSREKQKGSSEQEDDDCSL